MMKGPLVKAAFVLAVVLMLMSFAIVAFPGNVETLGAISAVVAVAVIIVLILMLIRMRKV